MGVRVGGRVSGYPRAAVGGEVLLGGKGRLAGCEGLVAFRLDALALVRVLVAAQSLTAGEAPLAEGALEVTSANCRKGA